MSPAACTNACTTEVDNSNAAVRPGVDEAPAGITTERRDSLAELAVAISQLSPTDREKLAALLGSIESGSEQ